MANIEAIRERHAAKFESNGKTEGRRIGIEMEFPMVSSRSDRFGHAVDLGSTKGILTGLAQDTGWEIEGQGLHLKKRINGRYSAITAEAGISTIEIAMPPASGLTSASRMITGLAIPLIDSASRHGAYALGYGVQPLTPPGRELFSPLGRYQTMLTTRSRFYRVAPDDSDISYTVTAASHFHVQTHGREDVVRLLNILNGFSPELLAISANSRVQRGADSGRADTRTTFYEDYLVTSHGAGVAPRFGSFDEYFDRLCMLPVELMHKDGRYVVMAENTSLGRFIERGYALAHEVGRTGRFYVRFDEGDVEIVEGTTRWEARAKASTGTVELRTCSMQMSNRDIMAIAATVLGLAENMQRAEAYIMRRSVAETGHDKREVARHGITPGVRMSALDMLDIAEEGLKGIGEDTSYLGPALERLMRGRTPSQDSAEVFAKEGVRPFIESLRFEPEA